MTKRIHRIKVYDGRTIVTRVRYNNALDHWNGSSWMNGSIGKHLGITRLRNSETYVLIHGSDYEGSRDYGVCVSPETALKAIVESGKTDILGHTKYRKLRDLYNKGNNR